MKISLIHEILRLFQFLLSNDSTGEATPDFIGDINNRKPLGKLEGSEFSEFWKSGGFHLPPGLIGKLLVILFGICKGNKFRQNLICLDLSNLNLKKVPGVFRRLLYPCINSSSKSKIFYIFSLSSLHEKDIRFERFISHITWEYRISSIQYSWLFLLYRGMSWNKLYLLKSEAA